MLQSKSGMMRVISIILTAVFLIVSISVSTESADAASKLKVSITKKTIYVGQTAKLKANKNVKWSVSNKKTAKLIKAKKRNVTVKGLKPGTVYVKAKAGKSYKKIRITVRKPKRLTLSSSKDVIGLGEYCVVLVSSYRASDINFSSSDSKVASVNSRGLVEGLSEGRVTITATSKKNKWIKGSIAIDVVATRAGTLTLNVDLSDETRYPAGKVAKVWLPVPQSDDHQIITQVNYDAPGATARLTEDSGGGKQLYIEWDENTQPKDRKASLSYHLYRRAIVRSEYIESIKTTVEDVDKTAFGEYLKETYWSGDLDSGIVKETADEIVAAAGAKTVYEMAFAINDWMCDNLVRTDDKTVIFGDVVSILKGYRGEEGGRNAGSCMDMNAVFVSLCRAEGIPARTLYGYRFTTLGVNCRAEFYLPGYGWTPADPALAIKQGRGLDSPPKHDNDATWLGIKDKFWGNAEENWICVNIGKDIWLDPPQSADTGGEYDEVLNPDGSINLFMFPYGEYDGQKIRCQDKANFRYEYSFDEENPLDCGC